MHDHEHDHLESDALRPKGARADERPEAALYKAAAAGRADVLGAQGLLRMQRAVGNAGTSALAEERSPVLDVVSSGGGQPMEEPVRKDMEGRFGASFADVRVHTDSGADVSAKAVNAHAYTVGSNIVFQRDRYDPSSPQGRTTLAHELTHVVQQRSGPVEGTPTGGGVSVSDPSDRFEREAASNAERVMSQPTRATIDTVAPAPSAVGDSSVQRESPEEEEEPLQALAVQPLAVQREGEDEEEESA